MLDIELIRNQAEEVKAAVARKGANPELVDEAKRIDKEKRRVQTEVEAFQTNLNRISKAVPGEFGQKKLDLVTEASQISAEIDKHRPRLHALETELHLVMSQIPNMPLPDVLDGTSEKDNSVAREWGTKPHFDFAPKDHVALAKLHDLIDFEAAGKASGSRFAYLKGRLAILEFALMRFGLDAAIKKGFIPVIPPVMLKREVMDAAGYLQQAEEEIYKTQDDLYLAGTSEQALLALHAGEVLGADQLPLRYVGFSSCFRREAGSYGKDVKGMLRMHQFQKLEMFSFVAPEQAEAEHAMMLAFEEELMQALQIPYQVINICAGDLGFPAAKKWDINSWMAGQGQYRETHSTSNCTDFQARRLNVRMKDGKGSGFVSTLNGTIFSERPLVAIMENFQQKDGSITVPKVLIPYAGFEVIK